MEPLERPQNILLFLKTKIDSSSFGVPSGTFLIGLPWVTPKPSHCSYGTSVNSNPHITDLNDSCVSFSVPNHFISKRNSGSQWKCVCVCACSSTHIENGPIEDWNDYLFSPISSLDVGHDPVFLPDSDKHCDFCLSTCLNKNCLVMFYTMKVHK